VAPSEDLAKRGEVLPAQRIGTLGSRAKQTRVLHGQDWNDDLVPVTPYHGSERRLIEGTRKKKNPPKIKNREKKKNSLERTFSPKDISAVDISGFEMLFSTVSRGFSSRRIRKNRKYKKKRN
jgi:hypothetical protein